MSGSRLEPADSKLRSACPLEQVEGQSLRDVAKGAHCDHPEVVANYSESASLAEVHELTWSLEIPFRPSASARLSTALVETPWT